LHSARDSSLLGRTDGKRNAFCEDLKDAFLTITARLLNEPCRRYRDAMILGGVDPCLAPQAMLECVAAAPVAARDKEGAGVGSDP